MNPRIQELNLQAIDFADATYKYDLSKGFQIQEWDKIRIDEFAKLIVGECVRYFNEDYQRNFDTLWRADLSKGIKEHFGVE
jgi:hypothetical protein